MVTKLENMSHNRRKRLNLLGEEDAGPELFSPPRIRAVQESQAAKKAEEEKERTRNASKKAASAVKKTREEVAKADRALQLALAKDQIEAEDKAVKTAQKEKEKQAKQAAEPLKEKPNTPVKARKALGGKKTVRFVSVDPKEVPRALEN